LSWGSKRAAVALDILSGQAGREKDQTNPVLPLISGKQNSGEICTGCTLPWSGLCHKLFPAGRKAGCTGRDWKLETQPTESAVGGGSGSGEAESCRETKG